MFNVIYGHVNVLVLAMPRFSINVLDEVYMHEHVLMEGLVTGIHDYV